MGKSERQIVNEFINMVTSCINEIKKGSGSDIEFTDNNITYKYLINGLPKDVLNKNDFIEVKYISATGEISKESFVVIEFEDCNGVWITNIKNLYYDGEPNQPDEFTININKEEDKNRLLDALKKAANNTKSEYLIQRAQANR